LKLSKRTEYAVRALVHVAKLGSGAYAQSRDLAAQERLPTKFLESVLLGLKRHGYLESKVGSGGGYRLTRPASKIVVGDLIKKLEGVDETDSGELAPDAVQGEAALFLIQTRMDQAQSKVLDQLTLEQLVEEVQKLARSRDAMYYI
jgi:Rrf2 family protein